MTRRACLRVIALLCACVFTSSSGFADTAVAVASEPGIAWGVAYGRETVQEARSDALVRCQRESGTNCTIILECDRGGYGSLSIRQDGPGSAIEAVGAVCGSDSRQDAASEARRICEWQVARNLDALSTSLEDSTFAMIHDALARSCPGLGNCSCNERQSWVDRSDEPE